MPSASTTGATDDGCFDALPVAVYTFRPEATSSLQLGEPCLNTRDKIRVHAALLDERGLFADEPIPHALLLVRRRRIAGYAVLEIGGHTAFELGRCIFARPSLCFLPTATYRIAVAFGQSAPGCPAHERHVKTPAGEIAEGITNTRIPELAARDREISHQAEAIDLALAELNDRFTARCCGEGNAPSSEA